MIQLACPVCREPLTLSGQQFRCPRGHSFDRAAQGYVNLLCSSAKKVPGDNREMVAARENFLSKGYYGFLRERIAAEAAALMEGVSEPVLIDSGCGEGYYTVRTAQALRESRGGCHAFGFDISKFALRSAARKDKSITWAVASVFEMPFPDASADLLTTIFAPEAVAEFARVVRPGGYLILAAPGADHLFGMKQVLYEKPYQNDTDFLQIPGFVIRNRVQIRQDITISGGWDIAAVFQMTPYCYRTPKEGRERLFALPELNTPAEFLLTIYQKQ